MGERINYSTTLDKDLLKEIKILAINKEKNVNDLLEEGMTYILDKYKDISESEPEKEE